MDLDALITQATPEQLAEALLALPEDQQRLLYADFARRDFGEFVRQAWPYTPCDPLVWSWYIEALCKHGAAVARGEIAKLAVNIAPGHLKSTIFSVMLPAWVWSWWPQCQFLCGSYSGEFAERDSMNCRALIDSTWYRESFMNPGEWRMRHDQNAKNYFINTAGGSRYATGIGGSGRRAHFIILDDANAIEEIYSKASRDTVNRWIGHTISQRWIDPNNKRLISIQQRLHLDDATGFLLRGGDIEHLCLMSEFEAARRSITYHFVGGERRELWRDPREREGELLNPDRFSRSVIDAAKGAGELGPNGFMAQHQQRPAPPGGTMFKIDRWRYWRCQGGLEMVQDGEDYAGRRAPIEGVEPFQGAANVMGRDDLEEVLLAVDATFRETAKGSFVAIHVWGKIGARRLLLDRVHRRMDFDDTVKEILRVLARWPEARRKRIEGKANGDAIVSTLTKQHKVTGIETVETGSAAKAVRANAMQPYQVAGNVELPDGAPWVADYIAEHAAFPGGLHNDDVDAQAMGLQGFEQETTVAETWAGADADELAGQWQSYDGDF